MTTFDPSKTESNFKLNSNNISERVFIRVIIHEGVLLLPSLYETFLYVELPQPSEHSYRYDNSSSLWSSTNSHT
jgi:hypothetical protein